MYAVSNNYNDVIYSGQAQHKLSLYFNNVEYTDANIKTEYVKIKSNILSNGEERFNLDNFVSKEVEIKIHGIDLDDILEPVQISIGTYVDNDYEYVPIGIFNLIEAPTKDDNVTTIKLRDNSVKFNVPYNAETIIQSNEGAATMLQILEDICTTCNVTLATEEFINDDTTVSVWDNTITARQYVMYIAEKAGSIATINRDGELELIPIDDNLTEFELDEDLIESYTEGDKFIISRVVYEDAIRKFEYGSIPDPEENHTTLYISASNPYITDTQEISDIYDSINGFTLYGIKISKILGNPALDPYDLISFTYNNKTYITFAQNTLTYNGVITQTFETNIGTLEKAQENVTINNEAAVYKRVFTRIDQAEGNIKLVSSDLEQNYYTIGQTNELLLDAKNGLTNTFTTTGGANIFRNTGLWFETNDSNNPYEFWTGVVTKAKEEKAANMSALLLQNGNVSQEQTVPNGNYTVSFKYKKLIQLANVKIYINDLEYTLTETTDTEFITGKKNADEEYIVQPLIVNSQHINIKFSSNVNNACEIYDLMVNIGETKYAYSQNQNETTTDTVNISKGITITSSNLDVKFKADADGIRTLDKYNNELTKFTDTGMTTEEATIKGKSQIVGTLWQEVENQTWITRL